MTSRICSPQVGQQARRAGGGTSRVGVKGVGQTCEIMRHRVWGGDRTAGMEKAEVTDFHEALRENVLEEPADKFDGVDGGGPWAWTAGCTVGEGDGTVLESHETSIGDGDPEDRGGEIGEGRIAIGTGLRVDIPGDIPDLWVDVRKQSGSAHVFFEEGAVERREGLDGDEEVVSGGDPGGAVLWESTTRDDGVDVGMVLELPAPGRQDAGETGEVRTDETLIFGEAFGGERRGVEQGLVGEALRRADEGSESLRDGEGDEKVWPRELSLQAAV